MTFDVGAARADLPSARASAYFNAGTFGPVPRRADAAMRAHLDTSFEQGRIGNVGFARWFRQMDETRTAFARSLGAHEDTLALMHCTTDGLDAVLFGLAFQPGDEIVTTTHEHPGLTAPLEELSRVRGVVVRAVEPRLEAIASALGPRTRLVAVSHVLWTNGDVLPLAAIAKAAHEAHALVLVDGAQAVGAIPVDVEAVGADFYTVSGQKWLCGPSGTGALWVRPSALSHLGTPWPWYLSKSRGPDGVRDWTTARRLDATTLSMTSMAGAIAALAWHREQVDQGALGWAAECARAVREGLARLPRVKLATVARPSPLVSFTVEGESPAAVSARLEAAGILVRSIPGFELVRVAVAFWNDAGDVQRLLQAMAV
jgi:L-cysteine/cystine lyase